MPGSENEPAAPGARVLVWDLPVRLGHWLNAALVAACYLSARLTTMIWHEWLGGAVLALVIFRLFWGVWGSESARFRTFLAPPRLAWQHLRRLFQREPDHWAGHNPAGGWMVLLLLLLLLGETMSGLYVNNDVANESSLTEIVPAGLSNAITAAHVVLWWTLAGAVGVHVAVIILYAVFKRQDLVGPMLSGMKTLAAPCPRPRPAPIRRAALLLLLSLAVSLALAWVV
jgi:cytochrome b